MSGKAFGWARDRMREGAVSGGVGARAVLLLMADYARPERGEDEHALWPSVATMALELGIAERTVQRALASLEADGLISRELRATATGKSTSSRYVLAIETWAAREGCQIDTPKGDSLAPSGVSDWRGEGVNLTPSTTLEPLTLSDESSDELSGESVGASAGAIDAAGSADFEGLPGDKARRAAADRVEAAYLRLEARWLEVAPGRVSEGKARMAFAAAVAEGLDPHLIAASGLRFLAESPDAKAGKVVLLHTFLAEKRWRGFEPKDGSANAAAGGEAGPTFDGPPELVSRVCAFKDRNWFASWLARCGWDAGERSIVARGDFAADRIRRDLKQLLEELKITVIVRRAA